MVYSNRRMKFYARMERFDTIKEKLHNQGASSGIYPHFLFLFMCTMIKLLEILTSLETI